MQVDIGWVTAFVPVAGFAWTIATWVERKRVDRRAALPSIMQDGGHITIINRLDEILELTSIRANGPIAMGSGGYGDDGQFDPEFTTWVDPPFQISLRIKPKEEKRIFVQVKRGERPPLIALVFSSSAKTLRNRRIPVEMFTTVHIPDHRPWPARSWSIIRSAVRRRLNRRI